jgi:hypothetical protein
LKATLLPQLAARSEVIVFFIGGAFMNIPTVGTHSPLSARQTAATQLSLATALSAIVALLALIASTGGLFWDGLYRDNKLVTAALRGNDLITLVIAVPGLVITLLMARRDSNRARLIGMGLLAYMLYNYVFYLYGAAFNRFFLLYVALVALSVAALIASVSTLDVHRISLAFHPRTPVRWISGYMLVFGLLLGGMWIAMSLSFVVTGQLPSPITQTGHPTGVVFATDLSMLMPRTVQHPHIPAGIDIHHHDAVFTALVASCLIRPSTANAADFCGWTVHNASMSRAAITTPVRLPSPRRFLRIEWSGTEGYSTLSQSHAARS